MISRMLREFFCGLITLDALKPSSILFLLNSGSLSTAS
jgi:hypothetical protein